MGLCFLLNENMDFNDLLINDFDNLKDLFFFWLRYYIKSKWKKKNDKLDVVIKLLLMLLVDKLKDIYEMDKINNI